MLSKTDSKAGKELVEKYAHEGTFRCPNPVLQGQLREGKSEPHKLLIFVLDSRPTE